MFNPTSKLTVVRRSLALATAIAALGVTATSFAAPANDVPEVTVRYSDLDLSTAAGVNSLYRRISFAAEQVCPGMYSRSLGEAAAAQRCWSEAVGKAVSATHNQQLAALYATHVSRG